VKYSIDLLHTMISQNQLSIMRLKNSTAPYAENAIRALQSQIDRWQQEIDARNSIERMRSNRKELMEKSNVERGTDKQTQTPDGSPT
jgi:hypothetical protein